MKGQPETAEARELSGQMVNGVRRGGVVGGGGGGGPRKMMEDEQTEGVKRVG